MPLCLITFGSPGLLDEDGNRVRVANAKHLVLLAFLVLESREHRRDWLATFVWGSEGAGSMNNALSNLREILGEAVFPKFAQQIQLRDGIIECDAAVLT